MKLSVRFGTKSPYTTARNDDVIRKTTRILCGTCSTIVLRVLPDSTEDLELVEVIQRYMDVGQSPRIIGMRGRYSRTYARAQAALL